MAYINQDQKKEKAAAIKKMIGEKYADFKIKYTMGIEHYTKLRFTIAASNIDFAEIYKKIFDKRFEGREEEIPMYYPTGFVFDVEQVNEYYLEDNFEGRILEMFLDIRKIMNSGNHDNSDIMTDYFDVGWYIAITIGRWNKPYILLTA